MDISEKIIGIDFDLNRSGSECPNCGTEFRIVSVVGGDENIDGEFCNECGHRVVSLMSSDLKVMPIKQSA